MKYLFPYVKIATKKDIKHQYQYFTKDKFVDI